MGVNNYGIIKIPSKVICWYNCALMPPVKLNRIVVAARYWSIIAQGIDGYTISHQALLPKKR